MPLLAPEPSTAINMTLVGSYFVLKPERFAVCFFDDPMFGTAGESRQHGCWW